MNGITFAGFLLALNITGMLIMDGVREIVFGWCFVFDMLVNGGGMDGLDEWCMDGMDSGCMIDWGSFYIGRLNVLVNGMGMMVVGAMIVVGCMIVSVQFDGAGGSNNG